MPPIREAGRGIATKTSSALNECSPSIIATSQSRSTTKNQGRMMNNLVCGLVAGLIALTSVASARADDSFHELSQAEFQATFNQMLSERQYPTKIVGYCDGATLYVDADFTPFPFPTFGFYAISGASNDQMLQRESTALSAGMRRQFHQWVVCGGRLYNQAIWYR